MECPHYDAGRCRSCTLLPLPRPRQVAQKEAHLRDLLGSSLEWLPTVAGPQAHFRNKAKMAVAGTVEEPTLGILDERGGGIDLRDCALHVPALEAALPRLAAFVTEARLTPYDVAARRGELKHLLVTASPDDELMVRFVLRSRESITRLQKHLPALQADLPGLRVASANLQPEHKAVLEGPDEILLTEQPSLPMRLNGLVLQLRPQSFFQTNTDVAAELYRTAQGWVRDLAPADAWDLYSGVGGFALHLAATGVRVTGIEISEEAVASASATAHDLALPATFAAGDAVAWALAAGEVPELVVVNPPRRGIGPELSGWLESSGVRHVLYSSCRAETLARDLGDMPSLRPEKAVLLDMFPNTDHYEVLTLLTRS